MSMGWMIAPLIVFCVVVAPTWLNLHYKSKREANQGLSQDEQEQLQALLARSEKMQSRIETLEKILDAEVPQWRER